MEVRRVAGVVVLVLALIAVPVARASGITVASRLLVGRTCSGVTQEAAERFLKAWVSHPQPEQEPKPLPPVRFCTYSLLPLQAEPMPMTTVHTASLSLIPPLSPLPFSHVHLRWRYAGLVRDTLVGASASTASVPTPTPVPTPTAAGVDAPLEAVVNDSNVRLRSGPGLNFSIVGKVQKGQRFQVVGRSKDRAWVQVCCWRGNRVWIYGKLVDIAAVAPEPISPTATPPTKGFSRNAYVPLDCGSYRQGEKVTVEAHGPSGEKLPLGWFFQKGPTANADATGWIHLFLVTQGWPAGTSTVVCRGERGKEHRVLVSIVKDSRDAVVLATGATPDSVSAKALESGTVYVRAAAPGFKPTELVKMTISPPGQKAQPFGKMQADWVGDAATVIVLDPGDPSGEWAFTFEGEESHHRAVVKFAVR